MLREHGVRESEKKQSPKMAAAMATLAAILCVAALAARQHTFGDRIF
jgi:hypothetical protein